MKGPLLVPIRFPTRDPLSLIVRIEHWEGGDGIADVRLDTLEAHGLAGVYGGLNGSDINAVPLQHLLLAQEVLFPGGVVVGTVVPFGVRDVEGMTGVFHQIWHYPLNQGQV
jgi:hypothetical protein